MRMRPLMKPSQLCRRPHGICCLAHAGVISGAMQACQTCAPHLPSTRIKLQADNATILPGTPIITRQKPKP